MDLPGTWKQTQRVIQKEETKEYVPKKGTRLSFRKHLNEMEIRNFPDNKFKVTVSEMLTELWGQMA